MKLQIIIKNKAREGNIEAETKRRGLDPHHFKLYSSYFNRVQKGTDKPSFIRVESVERKSDVAFITLYFEGDAYGKYVSYVKSCLSRYADIPETAIHCKKVDAHHLLCLTPENIAN